MTQLNEKQTLERQHLQQEPLQPPPPPHSPRDDLSDALVTDGFQLPDIEPEAGDPPPYEGNHDRVQFSQPGIDAGAQVTVDGRVNININTKNRRLAELLAPTLQRQIEPESEPAVLPPAYIPPSLGGLPDQTPPPPLNVVIQIVGSRGDVQPFVALGKVLRDTYGHRVRIATHATFQKFVEENGLEFFSIGGDPAELMAFMVKYPGLMPGFDAITSGEVSKRRKGISEILLGCWRSCIEAGNGLGPPPEPHAKNDPIDHALHLPGDPNHEPFVADAIIANPPSFAHIHIAEKMGIPLHMMFTMPWSPTRAFPHPLANVQSSNADDVTTNYLTYTLVEMMTWQGLGDVINRFRDKALDLPPLSLIWAPGLLARLKIPWTYCWSPALIPKPNDWGRVIDISGFYFLDLATSYTPDPELAAFLRDGPPPVYIGFGSIVVDDPNALTRMIFDAIHIAGIRALVSKGWGGLGADDVGVPEGVFMLGNVPHDWLFEHVSCVVHHGGAGTTAAGIKAGKPTLVVPFFGDQPFWGAMIARANAGPEPIPYPQLTAEKLAEAIKFCLLPTTLTRAQELGSRIREEKGTDVGGKSFHDHLDVDKLRCSVAPSRTAAWRVRRTQIRLSPMAAAVLVDKQLLQYSDLKLYRSAEYITEKQPPDPISACAASLVTGIGGIGMAIADMPREIFRRAPKAKDPNDASAPTEGSQQLSEHADDPASSIPPAADLYSVTPPASEPNLSTTHLSSTSQLPASKSQASLTESVSAQSLPTPSISQRPKSPGASTTHTRQSSRPDISASSVGGMSFNVAVGTGVGVGRIVATGAKTPMNFCLGMARGFRNIPRLYNDETIRPVEKVTDFSTGLKVAGKELGYGFFDGVAGLVTQPLKGAQKEGAAGLIKGFGKGIGGLIAKPAAGVMGVPAYTMQGVHAEINKFFSKSVQNYIITARAIQGGKDMRKATPGEIEDVLKRWNNVKFDLKNFYVMKRKEKTAGKQPEGAQSLEPDSQLFNKPVTGWLQTRKLSFDERKKLHAQRQAWKQGFVDAPVPPGSSGGLSMGSTSSEDAELERAIQASVRETSRGNEEEDIAVEAAIRESIRAVRERTERSAVAAVLPEKDLTIFGDEEYQITDEEYQMLVEEAIQKSLATEVPLPQEYGIVELDATSTHAVPRKPIPPPPSYPPPPKAALDPEDADFERVLKESRTLPPPPPRTDDDEELQRAIEESKRTPATFPLASGEETDEIQRAIEASRQAMKQEMSERTEEEIVMEYVKKQSLAEEEYRQKMSKGQEGEDEEEQFRRAMEESLKMSRGDESGPSRM